MEKLTNEQIDLLPKDHRLKVGIAEEWVEIDSATLCERSYYELAIELAKALTPQPCDHPRGCIVSAPYLGDEATAHTCGWCAAEAERDALRRALADARHLVYNKGALLREADSWRDRFMRQITELETERDALRERLAAAEKERDGVVKMLEALPTQYDVYRVTAE